VIADSVTAGLGPTDVCQARYFNRAFSQLSASNGTISPKSIVWSALAQLNHRFPFCSNHALNSSSPDVIADAPMLLTNAWVIVSRAIRWRSNGWDYTRQC